MSDAPPVFDVICLGGPFNGKVESVRDGWLSWKVWCPVWLAGGFGKELMGSYIVDPDRICATWEPQDIAFSKPIRFP